MQNFSNSSTTSPGEISDVHGSSAVRYFVGRLSTYMSGIGVVSKKNKIGLHNHKPPIWDFQINFTLKKKPTMAWYSWPVLLEVKKRIRDKIGIDFFKIEADTKAISKQENLHLNLNIYDDLNKCFFNYLRCVTRHTTSVTKDLMYWTPLSLGDFLLESKSEIRGKIN